MTASFQSNFKNIDNDLNDEQKNYQNYEEVNYYKSNNSSQNDENNNPITTSNMSNKNSVGGGGGGNATNQSQHNSLKDLSGGGGGGGGRKSRRVTFYKNGDKYFIGKLITITPQKYFSFKELMTELNRCVDLPYGVRRVYSPVSGRELHDIEDLVDGSSYVCASFEPFKATKYGDSSEKLWNAHIG